MRFLSFLTALVLAVSVQAADTPFRLAVFGDSLAAGYRLPVSDAFYTRLEKALQDKGYTVTVINASRSGETTAGGLKRQDALIAQKPDAVLLELGVNDAIRNVPVQDTKDNLIKLIETFRQNHIPVMLIGMQAPPNRDVVYRQSFAKMYQELAGRYNLILYPFFMDGIFTIRPGMPFPFSDKVLGDNIHPNATGVQTMTDNILPTVERFLKTHNIQ